jgi:hypothetical protein
MEHFLHIAHKIMTVILIADCLVVLTVFIRAKNERRKRLESQDE